MKKTTFLIIFFIAVWQLSAGLGFKVFAQTETPTTEPPTPTISVTPTPIIPSNTPTPSTTPSTDNTPTSIPKSPTPTQIKKATTVFKTPTATISPEPTVTPQPSITPTPTIIGLMEKLSGRTLTFFFILSGLLLLGISFVLYRKRG
ncbi:hypothetical protein A3D03_01405 [Candidatus Gottesmanbacteria bacterium RIFCSPHIGHO2_02_FULL_40_13]|uniref:Uncharacterized protein n=1 Tax=Candidatus Gottesmanbacteria bacterium RIFCSPHIGHO2_02_FULL_40_13 TaxID=1798384 RepID=A0A1F6AAT8_9BACT|nr:MAG: hypothetical protein A3D03_01405 [Candidatus Gottesmanbacteria bacterium RIFCSPHIGHO2_02_FULL_40_13]